MLRFLCALLIVAASIVIGCYLSARLTRRRAILSSYIALLDEAANRLAYTGENLAALFADNFAGFVFDPAAAFAPQWERMAEGFRDVLDTADRRVLKDFARELGRADAAAELNRIRLYRSLLEERFADARAACEKKGAVSRLLPFCIGLAISILLL